MITFTENKHEYKNAKKQKYTSVTTFIGQFQYGFNAEFWSKYKAVEALCDNTLFRQHLGKYGRKAAIEILANSIGKAKVAKKQKEIKVAWRTKNKKSTTRGTKKHNFKENASYERGWELNPVDGKKYDVFKKKRIKGVNAAITEDLYDLEEGFYPELMVWIHKFKLAGQADKVFVFYYNGFKWIDIGDYKTNEKITTENPYQNFKKPIDHLEDTKFNLYALQLSLYAYCLESFGFKIRNLSFDHYPSGEEPFIHYEVPYLKKEVEAMLHYSSSTLSR